MGVLGRGVKMENVGKHGRRRVRMASMILPPIRGAGVWREKEPRILSERAKANWIKIL